MRLEGRHREGDGGDEPHVEHDEFVVEDVEGHEELQRPQHTASRREEEGYVVDEQILVGEQIFEHPAQGEFLLRRGRLGALLAQEAEGHHEREGDHGACDAAAGGAAQTFDREHLLAFPEIVGEHGDHAVYGRVAEGVGAVVDEIGDGEPGKLRRLGDVCGYGVQQDDGDRDRDHGHPQPRHEFAALQFQFVEQRAEYGVVEGVPDLDQQEHETDFVHVHALQYRKGGEIDRDERVDEVLSREISVIAYLFLARDLVSLLPQPEQIHHAFYGAFARAHERVARLGRSLSFIRPRAVREIEILSAARCVEFGLPRLGGRHDQIFVIHMIPL